MKAWILAAIVCVEIIKPTAPWLFYDAGAGGWAYDARIAPTCADLSDRSERERVHSRRFRKIGERVLVEKQAGKDFIWREVHAEAAK